MILYIIPHYFIWLNDFIWFYMILCDFIWFYVILYLFIIHCKHSPISSCTHLSCLMPGCSSWTLLLCTSTRYTFYIHPSTPTRVQMLPLNTHGVTGVVELTTERGGAASLSLRGEIIQLCAEEKPWQPQTSNNKLNLSPLVRLY